MNIIKLCTGPIKVNTYIIHDDREAAIIDPGGNEKRIFSILDQHNLHLSQIFLTHGHFDHIGAVSSLKTSTSAMIYIHENDQNMLYDDRLNLSFHAGLSISPSYADVLLQGNEKINTPAGSMRVIHTPGHTQGGVCYLINDLIFTGDTLFFDSIGRTDFPGGSFDQLNASIKEKLFTLEHDYKIYPGHDQETTLYREKAENPFLSFGWKS